MKQGMLVCKHGVRSGKRCFQCGHEVPWLTPTDEAREAAIATGIGNVIAAGALVAVLAGLAFVLVLLLNGCGDGRPPPYERWNVSPCDGRCPASAPAVAPVADAAVAPADAYAPEPPDASVPDAIMPPPDASQDAAPPLQDAAVEPPPDAGDAGLGFCKYCEEDAECASGYCGPGSFCSEHCTTDCGDPLLTCVDPVGQGLPMYCGVRTGGCLLSPWGP